MTNWNWETVFMVSTAAICGVTIGMWLARREILTQCRLLGGFYVGNTTVTVEKINGPDVYTTGGYIKGGQAPMHRPSSPPPGAEKS